MIQLLRNLSQKKLSDKILPMGAGGKTGMNKSLDEILIIVSVTFADIESHKWYLAHVHVPGH